MKPEEIKQAEDWILDRLYFCGLHNDKDSIEVLETCLIALKEMKPEGEEHETN